MAEADAPAGPHTRPSVTWQMLAVLSGTAAFAFLLGLAGSLTHQTEQGVAAGLVIGPLAGWGMSKGYVRPVVGRMFLFAVICALMGTGCDADPLFSSLCGSAFGFVMTWQRTVVFAMALIGAAVTNSFFGLLIAGTLGWWLAYQVPTQIRRRLTKRTFIDRPSYASLRGQD